MKKQIGSVYVRVELPDYNWRRTDECLKKVCADIMRHVDNVQSADIARDDELVCEFCSYPWNPGDDGCNDCCEAEVADHAKRIANAQ